MFNENISLVSYTLNALHIVENFNEAVYMECKSEALEGLFSAVKTFDQSKGFKFSTYAIKCIKMRVWRYLREITQRRRKNKVFYVSMEQEVGDSLTLRDTLESKEKSAEETIIEEETMQELLACLVTALTTKEQELYSYFLEGFNQVAIGLIVKLSQASVSRKLKRSSNKIRFVYKEMDKFLDKPRREQFGSDRDYRSAYQKYYYTMHRTKLQVERRMEIHKESPRIDMLFSRSSFENKKEALVFSVKNKLEKTKNKLTYYQGLLNNLEVSDD